MRHPCLGASGAESHQTVSQCRRPFGYVTILDLVETNDVIPVY
jgi:hypothetical protein